MSKIEYSAKSTTIISVMVTRTSGSVKPLSSLSALLTLLSPGHVSCRGVTVPLPANGYLHPHLRGLGRARGVGKIGVDVLRPHRIGEDSLCPGRRSWWSILL